MSMNEDNFSSIYTQSNLEPGVWMGLIAPILGLYSKGRARFPRQLEILPDLPIPLVSCLHVSEYH